MLGWVENIEDKTKQNTNFRTALFTGKYLQLTVMNIEPGGEVGLEVHPSVDQFIRLEKGKAKVTFGKTKEVVGEEHAIEDDWAIIIPAGIWHNVINTGDEALKLYSIYAPPNHPDGTVHVTKADADAAEAAKERVGN